MVAQARGLGSPPIPPLPVPCSSLIWGTWKVGGEQHRCQSPGRERIGRKKDPGGKHIAPRWHVAGVEPQGTVSVERALRPMAQIQEP